MGKERRKIARRSFAEAERNEDDKEGKRSKGSPVLEGRAEPNATVVKRGEQCREAEADDEMWKINWTPGNAIELQRIEPRENVAGDAAYSDRFPRTDDEIGKHHHPSGGQADGAAEWGCGGGGLPRGDWHGGRHAALD